MLSNKFGKMDRLYSVFLFLASLDAYKDDGYHEMACLKIAGEVLFYASLVPVIEPQMNKTNLWNYYVTIEMPALNIILQMLLNGIVIDREELVNTREDLLVAIYETVLCLIDLCFA